jgi:integrase
LLIKNIKPAMVEKYQHQRLQEPTRYGNPRSTANVNRTMAVLKRMFNLAVREELAERNPCWKIKMLPENNTRDRILSVDELERLLGYLPLHAGRVVHFAYLTGMRAGEIFNLTWDKVDLAQELVRLGAEDTKTSEPRVVFLCDGAYDILKAAGRVRSLVHNRVFTYRGKPLKKIKKAFTNACRKAGIVNFRFHDLRHTFNTNMRKAGVDQSVIMKLTGHKTPSMFQRYNTVDVDDAKLAYRRLEKHLSQEHAQSASRTGKCSQGAPNGRRS